MTGLIIATPTNDGYHYSLNDEIVAIGSYIDGMFSLIETDDSISVHENGMLALIHLRKKHTPGFYSKPVKHTIPVTQSPINTLNKYRKCDTLRGVYPTATNYENCTMF